VAFFGGHITSTTFTNTVEVFDPSDDSFTGAPSMLIDRMRPSVTVLNDGRIFVAGGASAGGSVTTNSTEIHYGLMPNAAPAARAGEDQTVECTSTGASVTLDGTDSDDPDGDDISYEWSAAGIAFDDPTSATPMATFPNGPTLVTLTVTDGRGGVDVDDVLVTVVDTTPPVIQCTTDIIALWPPNHEMAPVVIRVEASDACSDPGDVVVTCSVASSESDDATGDGAFAGDVDGCDGCASAVSVTLSWSESSRAWIGVVDLRAERDGSSAGRTYSISCEVEDGSGNTATASCVVVVPHDKRKK
jgi:hypothetical protein